MVLNDDDVIHKEYIEKLQFNIKKENVDLVYSDFNFIDMNNKISKPKIISLNYEFTKYPIYIKSNSNFCNLLLLIFFKNLCPVLFGLFRTQSLLNSLKYFRYFDRTFSNYDTLFLVHFLTKNKVNYINKKMFFYRKKNRFKIYTERKNPEVLTYTDNLSNIRNIYNQLILSIKIFQIIQNSIYIKKNVKLFLFIFIIINYLFRSLIYILKFFYGITKKIKTY